MAQHKHPFIDGLNEVPENRTKEYIKIRNWLATQPHLPEVSDDFVYLFLHAGYYNVDAAKRFAENYFSIRTRYPSLFKNRDVYTPQLQTMMGMANLVRLPKLSPEGYRIMVYSVRDSDTKKFVFSEAVKGFCMYNDCVLSEDGLMEGYVVIFDMKGVSVGHVARVSLPHLKAFMTYIQDAHPARLKAIHVLNTANFIHHIMRVILPLVRSDLINLVKFHKGCEPDGVPKELLPADYGGESETLEQLNKENFVLMEKYAPWLRDSEKHVVDESKRPKKNSWWNLISGTTTTESLEKQKERFFANLQID